MSKNNKVVLVEDVQVSAADMVLPATLLFLLLYYPLTMVVGARENPVSGTLFLLLFFLVIFGILYGLKFISTRGNTPLPYFLKFINSNVGLDITNWLVIILALVCTIGCWFTGNGWVSAACIAICIGFAVNLTIGDKYWELDEFGEGWKPSHKPSFSPVVPTAPPGTNLVKRIFSWDKILDEKNITHGEERFEVVFAEPDFKDDSSSEYVREKNPFLKAQPCSDKDYVDFASKVKPGSGNKFETAAISQIIQSAEEISAKYSLPDYEMYDLLLKFCQYNINYIVDEKSEPIFCTPEYFRFPGETLFDQEGDCDCKSVLAYNLFDMIGAKVELVSVCINSDDNPNHGLNHAAIILKDGKIPLPPQYNKEVFGKNVNPIEGVFCEATSKGYDPGNYSPNMDKDTVTIC